LVNLLLALVARLLSRQVETEAMPELSPADAADPHPERLPAWLSVAAAGIVGFAFFLVELVWYRMLGPLLGGSTFTFGIILVVALAGTGLGGAAYALRRDEPGPSGLAFTCLLEAVLVGLPFVLGDRLAILAAFLRPLGTLGLTGLAS